SKARTWTASELLIRRLAGESGPRDDPSRLFSRADEEPTRDSVSVAHVGFAEAFAQPGLFQPYDRGVNERDDHSGVEQDRGTPRAQEPAEEECHVSNVNRVPRIAVEPNGHQLLWRLGAQERSPPPPPPHTPA